MKDSFFYKGKEFYCSLAFCMELIGGKWKPLILFHLIDGAKRSGELQKSVCGVTNKMFTQNIRELEKDGLVHRKVYPVVPPRVEYALTDLGKSLIPILEGMDTWGKQRMNMPSQTCKKMEESLSEEN